MSYIGCLPISYLETKFIQKSNREFQNHQHFLVISCHNLLISNNTTVQQRHVQFNNITEYLGWESRTNFQIVKAIRIRMPLRLSIPFIDVGKFF